MVQKIVDVKDPVLRKKAKEVKVVDKKIQRIIKNMKDTLFVQKEPEGVGLAAPQIGKSLAIFIIDYKKCQRVIINPKIIAKKDMGEKTKKKDSILEGCLSLPNFYGPIKRDSYIKIEYLDEKGQSITEEFRGFFAQIVQHEIDHLNGILFIDHILSQKSPLYKFEDDEWEEVDLIK